MKDDHQTVISQELLDKSRVENLKVSDLEVDRKVQRWHLDLSKVERIKRRFNPGAVGLIAVSKRNAVTFVVLDGMHRVQAVKELTDGSGEILCRVFEDLTMREEGQIFLDLNEGNKPSLLDKFRVRENTGEPLASGIAKLLAAYGWSAGNARANGQVQCIGTIEYIYRDSLRSEIEPNTLQLILMLVTRAWGNVPEAMSASLIEGLHEFIKEYTSLIDLDSLQRRLKEYSGGPLGLLSDAQAIARMNKRRVVMAVAERLTDEYNRGRSEKRQLSPWRRRSQRKRLAEL